MQRDFLSACRFALLSVASATVLPAQISVGPNVQVSKSREKLPHFELLANADPTNPNHLIGCSYVYPESPAVVMTTIVYSSFDAGKTWMPTLDEKTLNNTGDPICTFGPDNVAYYVALTIGDPKTKGAKSGTLIYRSTDGGRTWPKEPVRMPFVDREFALVDNTKSKYRGSVYINGTWGVSSMNNTDHPTAMGVIRSRDGIHFEGPVGRIAGGQRFILGMGNSVVLSDGTLVLVTDVVNSMGALSAEGQPGPYRPNASLEIVTSEDGGETLSASTKVADLWQPAPYTGTSINPYMAVDPSDGPFKDRLYIVWPDRRSGRVEIMVSYSSDKGKTWTSPQVINDDRPPAKPSEGPDHLMPVIGVNKDGVVGIVWYDRRDNPDGLGWYIRFSASLDGGDTWLPSVRVSDAPASFQGPERFALRPSSSGGGTAVWNDGKINPPPPPRSGGNPISVSMGANDFSITGGHYSGLAVDAAGIFRPMWVDNRTGVAQLWTAGVTVKGTSVKNGSAELANLDDISEKVELSLTNGSFDRGASTVTWTAKLKNTSKDTIRAPLKGRVIELKSAVGVPKFASDGGRAEGTILDFTPLLKNNVLLPGDSTATRQIVVKLNDMRPIATSRDMKYSLVSMKIRVLAPEVKKPAAPAEEKK